MKTQIVWLLVVAGLVFAGRAGAQADSAEANVRSANMLKMFGDRYTKDGNAVKAEEMYSGAADSFRKAIKLKPDGAAAYFGLGDIYLNCLRKYELALPVWMKLDELRPGDPEVLLLRGLTFRALKRYDEALGDFRAVLETKARAEWLGYAHQDIGLVHLDRKEYALAVPAFGSAIELDSSNDKAWNELGLAHYGLGQYAEAAAAYERAARLKPEHAAYRANVGLAYAAIGRKDDALDVYREVVKLDKTEAKWLRGRMEEFSVDVSGATAARLGESERAAVNTYLQRGDGHLRANEVTEALDAYQRALKVDPESGRAHDGLAVCYYRQGRWQMAVAEWDRALPWIRPGVNTYLLVGNAQLALKQYDKALAAYREAAGLKPGAKEMASVEFSIGRVYREKQQYAAGIGHLREALRLNPDLVDASFVLGECHFYLYRYGEAAAALEKVVAARPKSAQARALLGYSYANLGRLDAARAQYEALKPLDADKAEMVLGEIERRSK